MFHIGILEDDKKELDWLEKLLLFSWKDPVKVYPFNNGSRLWEELLNGLPLDLLFLDIQMEGINGIDIGRKIRAKKEFDPLQIVYISNSEDYYPLLFPQRPNNFLLKPLTKEVVLKEVEKAYRLFQKSNPQFIYKKSGELYQVPYSDILYFESDRKKIRVVSVDGVQEFYERLERIEERLEYGYFLRIHQSYLVGIEQIQKMKYEEVYLKNGNCLPISQSRRQEIREIMLHIMENHSKNI